MRLTVELSFKGGIISEFQRGVAVRAFETPHVMENKSIHFYHLGSVHCFSTLVTLFCHGDNDLWGFDVNYLISHNKVQQSIEKMSE